MSKRTKTTTLPNEDERREQLFMERCTFALLVNLVAKGTLRDYLKDKAKDELAFYSWVWDAYCETPVGVMFRKPDILYPEK